jgi:hypothetical protein
MAATARKKPSSSKNVVALREPEITTTVETVDPDTARIWLEHNEINRTPRAGRIARYAHDMRAGKWKLTGEPIIFSRTGRLLDGQQRLMAVIEAGTEVRFNVTRGVEDDVQQYVDQGAARSPGDALRLAGYFQVTALAAAARLGVLYDNGALLGQRLPAVSHADILAWVQEHPGLDEIAKIATRSSMQDLPLRPSVRIYSCYRFSEIDEAAAHEFFEALGTLAGLPKKSPILMLSRRLRRIREDRERVDPRTMLALVFRTWNAWRQGQEMSSIPVYPRGQLPALPDLV